MWCWKNQSTSLSPSHALHKANHINFAGVLLKWTDIIALGIQYLAHKITLKKVIVIVAAAAAAAGVLAVNAVIAAAAAAAPSCLRIQAPFPGHWGRGGNGQYQIWHSGMQAHLGFLLSASFKREQWRFPWSPQDGHDPASTPRACGPAASGALRASRQLSALWNGDGSRLYSAPRRSQPFQQFHQLLVTTLRFENNES